MRHHPYAWTLVAAAFAFVLRVLTREEEREQDWDL